MAKAETAKNERLWAEFQLDTDEHTTLEEMLPHPLLDEPGVITGLFVAYAYVDANGEHTIGYRVAGQQPYWHVTGMARTALDLYEANFTYNSQMVGAEDDDEDDF
jgi:hypothetical protein